MKTVLVLEDEPVVMNVFRHVLSKEYTVLESESAETAFRRFREISPVHLLIADVSLPGTSGIRVALELRSRNDSLKIILTSGYPRDMWPDQERAEIDELPSDSVATLLKPFTPSTLRSVIERLINPGGTTVPGREGRPST